MSVSPVPPGRGDHLDLRELSRSEQEALLRRMFGGSPPVQPSRTPTFVNVGAVVRETVKSLVCMPLSFPEAAVMDQHSNALSICVDSWAFSRRQQPRRDDQRSALKAAIGDRLPKRGVVSLPFSSPATWTARTLLDVLRCMRDVIPPSACDNGKFNLRVSQSILRPAGHVYPKYDTLNVNCYTKPHHLNESPFSAELRLQPGCCPAIADWLDLFPDRYEKHESFRVFDDAELEAVVQEELAGDDDDPDGTLRQNDDDDLDAIEKAARRTLHGERAIPDTSKEAQRARVDPSTPDDRCSTSLRRVFTVLNRLQPAELKTLADFAESFFEKGGSGHGPDS